MNKLNPRVWTFLFLGVTIFALMLLAVSLSSLELDPGSPIPLRQFAPNYGSSDLPDGFGRVILALLRIILIAGWVILPFYIIYLIISKEARKRFVRDMIALLPFLILLYLLSTSSAGRTVAEEFNPGAGFEAAESMDIPPGEDIPAFVEPPAWITTVTSLVLAAGITLLVVGFIFILWRRSRQRPLEPLRMVEKEAQAALDAIEAGGDIRDAIMRCYYQMLKALSEYRNITRGRDMTPHEFEVYLQERGLHGDAVHQLTLLFEQVRYGAQNPGRQEERAAINSLSAIVKACQRTMTQKNGALGLNEQ